MPPVEHSPTLFRKSIVELKSVGKARELPVVSDTIDVASTFANQISENKNVQSAKHMVEEGIKTISETQTFNSLQGKVMELNENARVKQTLDTMKVQLSGAVEQLDSLAADGLEKVTTVLPALTTPTPELVETTKDAARSYFSLATEYMASFTVAQLSLKIADKSLSVAEKATKFFTPDVKSKDGMMALTYSKLRQTRRALRAVKRAGERKSYLDKEPVARVGLVGSLASLLSLNTLLGMAGLNLVAKKPERAEVEDGDDAEDEQHRQISDLKGDLAGYKSDEDPDYHPHSEDDSLDSSSDSGEETDDEMSEDPKDKNEEESEDRVPLSPAMEAQ